VNVTNTQVAGDDHLTFINTYFGDVDTGTVKHLSAYAPASDGLTHLRDSALAGEDDPPFADAGRLFFASADPVHADEPWVSDGTVAGTQIMANLAQEIRSNDSNPASLTDVNGTLYFAADDGLHGAELWKTDGTASGTSLAFDIVPGSTGSNPTQSVNWNGSLYFFTGGQFSASFMRTTGPVSAVTTLAPLAPEPRPTDPNFSQVECYFPTAVPFNGRLYFGASDGTSGFELWSTDGTAAGTTRLADTFAGPASSAPCGLIVFNGRLYFRATAGAGAAPFQLWSTDGTPAGTGPALPGAPMMQLDGFSQSVVFNNRMYFVALDANSTGGVYSTDGTAAGTQLLMAAPATSSGLNPIGNLNGRLLLLNLVYANASYQEIWLSDGTSAATVQLAGVKMPIGTPVLLTSNLIYFMNSDSTGLHPWVSDGTAAGTHMLADLNPGTDSDVRWFADFRGEVYFSSNDSTNGARIWRTNGTTAGTVVVGSSALPQASGAVQVSGENLFFAASDSAAGLELNAVQNDSPLAANDSGNSVNGAAVTINVLANDIDSDGSVDPTTVHIGSQPAHGGVSVTQSGTVVYTPNAGYQGSDSFTYSETDNQGSASNIATVTVTTTQPAPPSSGGGGAVDLLELLGLAGLIILRRCPWPFTERNAGLAVRLSPRRLRRLSKS
jgi:ELWxxDGT repeat protein